jgi:hypothetical protein
MNDEIPAAPAIRSSELWVGVPFALLSGSRHSIGWQMKRGKGGEPTAPISESAEFATLRRSPLGTYKAINTFPLTWEGWEQAWREIATLEPAILPRLRQVLAQRIEENARRAEEAARASEAESAVPQVPARSSPEVRARILQMFKRLNSKYAKPFENDRLAVLSVMGGNWEEYGQVVLQMAILDTLLSIEELLANDAGSSDEDQ